MKHCIYFSLFTLVLLFTFCGSVEASNRSDIEELITLAHVDNPNYTTFTALYSLINSSYWKNNIDNTGIDTYNNVSLECAFTQSQTSGRIWLTLWDDSTTFTIKQGNNVYSELSPKPASSSGAVRYSWYYDRGVTTYYGNNNSAFTTTYLYTQRGVYITYGTVTNDNDLMFYNQDYLPHGLEFTPYNNAVTSIDGYQGVNVSKYDYSIASWKLGDITRYTNFESKYQMILYNQGGYVVAQNFYNNIYKTNTSTDLDVKSITNEVFVRSRILQYNQVYTFVIYALNGDDEVVDSVVHTFCFLPLNSNISGDIILSVGSGDYTVQDSTNDLHDTLTDNADAEMLFMDFLGNSGDALAEKMGYNPIANPFVQIVSNTLQSLIDIVSGNQNETLSFDFYGTTYVLHSENFNLPNGSFKTFITILSNGLLVWAICKYGFILYQWINSGRLQNLVNEANGHWYKALF